MWKKRLVAELARDKKKAGILIVLAITAVFFVGKLLLKGSPAAAVAMQTAAPVTPQAPVEPSGMQNPAALPLVDEIQGMKTPRDSVKRITRDIFMPNPKVFPLVVKSTGTEAANKPNVVKDEEAKRTAELKRKTERIRQEGAELHLEGAIIGRVPIAIINGSVLGPGGVINGFRIVKIESQTCVVEKEGIKLSLTME
jgi:hypothetical protein